MNLDSSRRWLVPALLLLTLVAIGSSSAWAKDPIAALLKNDKSAPTSNEDEFLKPDEAFNFSAVMSKPDAITLTWVIAKDYYLYRDRIKIKLDSDANPVQLGTPQFPEGQVKEDEYFGKQVIFHEVLDVSVPVARAADAKGDFKLKVQYQGCAEAGLCYNPIDKFVTLTLPPTDKASTLAGKSDASSSSSLSSSSGGVTSEQDRLATLIRDGNLLLVLATFFGLGALLSLTPCVLPMIPILSGIIVGQGEKVTPLRGFSLAFTYVQGMAITYAAAGAIFVLVFKQAPQAFFQLPAIVIGFSILFIVLAFAMFGAFTLQMPSALQSRLTDVSNQQKTGTYIGTFIMGALSALIVTACVAPAMIAALSVISQTHMIARGAGALYAMGLGMGLPLLLVGASAGSLLPKAGAWMDAVKSVFGVMFLGLAIYLMSSLLPGAVTMALWATLAIVFGFWLFSLMLGSKQAPSVVRGLGLLVLVYGIVLLIGALAGRTDPLQPLVGLGSSATVTALTSSTANTSTHALPFKRIKSVADLENQIVAAKSAGKPIMLDFVAAWCVSCKEMEKYTFSDPQVGAALAAAVLLQADVTANDADDQALLNRFGIFGPPSIMFFGADGVERKNFRVVGYMKAEQFRAHVTTAFSS